MSWTFLSYINLPFQKLESKPEHKKRDPVIKKAQGVKNLMCLLFFKLFSLEEKCFQGHKRFVLALDIQDIDIQTVTDGVVNYYFLNFHYAAICLLIERIYSFVSFTRILPWRFTLCNVDLSLIFDWAKLTARMVRATRSNLAIFIAYGCVELRDLKKSTTLLLINQCKWTMYELGFF